MNFLKTKKMYPLWMIRACATASILIAGCGFLLTKAIALTTDEQKNLPFVHAIGYGVLVIGIVLLVKSFYIRRKPTVITVEITAYWYSGAKQ